MNLQKKSNHVDPDEIAVSSGSALVINALFQSEEDKKTKWAKKSKRKKK